MSNTSATPPKIITSWSCTCAGLGVAVDQTTVAITTGTACVGVALAVGAITGAVAVASTVADCIGAAVTVGLGGGVSVGSGVMVGTGVAVGGNTANSTAVAVAVSVATHSATFAVLLVLLAAAAVLAFVDPRRLPLRALVRGAVALIFGAVLVLATNAIITKRLTWTPGGFALSFGRMLQDGIVKKYLDEHCPRAKLVLCAYKDELPRDADEWFWGNPLFDRLGRFAGLDTEMERIALASIAEYPLLQIKTAAIATARQLIHVRTGEGVVNSVWHTYGIVERHMPRLVPEMRAARQQRGEIDFTVINRLHYPLALACLALLPLISGLALRRGNMSAVGELAAWCLLAVLANAFICGTLSNPHDRYGARLIWLAGATVMLAAVCLYAERRRLRAAAFVSSPP